MKITYFFILLFSVLLVSCSGNKKEIKKDSSANDTSKFSVLHQTIKTSDELNIAADYYSPKNNQDTPQPLVILIHQFQSNKEQWSPELINSLLNEGMKVICYDIRSHGKSEKAIVDLNSLLTSPEQAPKDLKAVIEWSKTQKGVDSNRIGICGTSIGGSLALYGEIFLGAKAIVCISVGLPTFEGLTGLSDKLMSRPIKRISNVLMICGTKDGDYNKDSKQIYENFTSEPRDYKEFESDKHGKDLIKDYPGINNLIVNWFKTKL